MHLFEGPPDTFHVFAVHCFVIILEINPSSVATNASFPLFGKPHDDFSAPFIVFCDTNCFTFDGVSNLVNFINFKFNWETMAIPTESAFTMMTSHSGVAGDDILKK